MDLMRRYSDAYLVASTINTTGQTIKVVGIAAAAAVALGGCAVGSQLGGAVGFAGVLLGAIVALPFYVLGVLVAAQGQILRATIDTAVNTSPLISREELLQVLSLEHAAARADAHPPTGFGGAPGHSPR